MVILYAETQQRFRNCDPSVFEGLGKHHEVLLGFLAAARRRSLLRKGIDIDIVAGTLLERLNNQVHYADFIQSSFGNPGSFADKLGQVRARHALPDEP